MSPRLPLFPITRGDCAQIPRPCPYESCRYHLSAEAESCALDVADRGPQDLKSIAGLLGVSMQRVQQIETRALRTMAFRARDHR